ncbi:MAG: hypothetical protein ORN49_06570 [Rhodobacteraceae bacterium]|nr:hypothetical protein [Paracoccaceae bacterium]
MQILKSVFKRFMRPRAEEQDTFELRLQSLSKPAPKRPARQQSRPILFRRDATNA